MLQPLQQLQACIWFPNPGDEALGTCQVGTGEIVCDKSLHGLLKSFRRAA